jgi:hypothetical protein
MKNLKVFWLIGAAVVAVALFVGASGPARPASATADNWVSLGDSAGFVLTTRNGDTVGAELWVKDHGKWVRGRVENPFVTTNVSR